METDRKFKVNFEVLTIGLAVSFFLAHLFFLNIPFISDEGTHALISLFYRDLIKFILAGNFSFSNIYNYSIAYLVHYPKLSIYYPPLFHILGSIFFIFYPSIYTVRLLSLLMGALSIFMLYKLALLFTKDEKVSFISAVLLATSLLINKLSSLGMTDNCLLLFGILSVYIWQKYFENKINSYVLTLLSVIFIFARQQMILVFGTLVLFNAYKHKWKLLWSLVLVFLAYGCYSIVLFKLGVLQTSVSSEVMGPNENDPTFFELRGWTYYPLKFILTYLVFPLSILGLYGFYDWFKEKKDWQILLLILFFVNLIFFIYIPNKDERFTFVCIIPLSISAAQILSRIFNNLTICTAIIAILFIASFVYSHAFYLSKNFDYSAINNLNEKGDVLIASENGNLYSGVIMAEYATKHPNHDKIFYRPCSIFNNKTISDNIKYVILVEPVDYNYKKEYTENINFVRNSKDLFNTIKLNNGENFIEIYENKKYDSSSSKCNFICIKQSEICYN